MNLNSIIIGLPYCNSNTNYAIECISFKVIFTLIYLDYSPNLDSDTFVSKPSSHDYHIQ